MTQSITLETSDFTGFNKSTFVRETAEMNALLRGPSVRGITSRELGWNGFVIETHRGEPGERPEAVSDRYILALWLAVGTGEAKNSRGIYVRYIKTPGLLTFVPPGVVPAVIAEQQIEWICCSLDASLVCGIEDSLDQRPKERARYRTGFEDPHIKELVLLLASEAAQGGLMGHVYAEHLAHALSVRLLYLGDTRTQKSRCEVSPLPPAALRRVLERMQDFSADLSLNALAAESGYSRRHFLRMFERATGYTPHRYLLQLRLQRAKELLQKKSVPLIDVAAYSGFSSQSHMSRIFRRFYGSTPAEVRRSL